MSVLPEQLAVLAADADGAPISGATVSFEVTGGAGAGVVTPGSVVTGADGVARAQWTLGSKAAESHVVRVRATDPRGTATVETAFNATATAGPASVLTIVSGSGQIGDPGNALAQPLRVRVEDAWQNPVAGIVVTWAATAGGGSVTSVGAATGTDGIAQATWTLGSASLSQNATASAAGKVATFTATLTPPGPLATLTLIAGDNQTGSAGTELPIALGVRAQDAQGRPISGLLILFQVTSGGGSFFAGSAATNADGEARDRWTLGPSIASVQRARARVVDPNTGVSREVLFSATPVPGPAASIIRVSGDEQSAPAGQALAQPLVVRVTDAFGNLVPNTTVTWSASQGGGSVNPTVSTTNTAGLAQTMWTLGSSGTQAASATSGTQQVTFEATAIITPPGWEFLADMPVAVRSAGIAVLNGRVHILGGYGPDGYTDAHQIYDPANNTWTTGAAVPVKGDNSGVTATSAGIHVMGGATSNGPSASHWIYNAATNSWTSAPVMPQARRAFAAVTLNDRIFVMGGLSNDDVLETVLIYDVAQQTWSTTASMPAPRFFGAATLFGNEIVYTGGTTSYDPLPNVYAFNPTTSTWREVNSLPESRMAHAVGVLGNRLCMVGGRGESTDVFCRVGDGGWENVGVNPRARAEMATVVVGGRLYMFGGTFDYEPNRLVDRMGPFPNP